MKSFIFVTAFASLSILGGCSVSTSQDDDAATSDDQALTSKVTPGDFKLYDLGVTPSPNCDIFTLLSLKQTATGPTADLHEAVSGACQIALPADARTFSLKQTGTSCGAKTFEGKRRVRYSFAGNDADNFATIKITDNRARNYSRGCEGVRIMAPLVVEETNPGFPGAITMTKRSLDDGLAACSTLNANQCTADERCHAVYQMPACPPHAFCAQVMMFKSCEDKPVATTVSGSLVRTMGIGGENTGFSVTLASGNVELVLDADQKAAFVEGRVARVAGTNTTLSGVETHNRPAINVTELLVCPAPGTFIDMMPGANRTPVTVDDNWVLANCPNVHGAF